MDHVFAMKSRALFGVMPPIRLNNYLPKTRLVVQASAVISYMGFLLKRCNQLKLLITLATPIRAKAHIATITIIICILNKCTVSKND